MQVVAAVHPDLLHHDALAFAFAVGHNGGVAAVRIVFGLVVGAVAPIFHEDVGVQVAVLVVLGQTLDDGVPAAVTGVVRIIGVGIAVRCCAFAILCEVGSIPFLYEGDAILIGWFAGGIVFAIFQSRVTTVVNGDRDIGLSLVT